MLNLVLPAGTASHEQSAASIIGKQRNAIRMTGAVYVEGETIMKVTAFVEQGSRICDDKRL